MREKKPDSNSAAQKGDVPKLDDKHYRLIVEKANEVIIVAQEGKFKFVNSKVEEVAGYSVRELIDKPINLLIHPDDEQMVIDRHRRCLTGEKFSSVYNFKIITKSGETRWAEINAILFDWEGRPATLNFLSDITDRVRLEILQKESAEKFLQVFNTAPLLMAISTIEEGRFVEVNESFISSTGYGRDEVIGRTSLELKLYKYPDQRERLRGLLNTRGSIEGEQVDIVFKSGVASSCLFWARRLDLSGGKYWLTTAIDVTDYKSTEARLRASEMKFRGFYESIPDGMAQTDAQGRIVDCNDAFLKMLGYDRDELIGRSYMDITPERWHEKESSFIRKTVFNKGKGEFEKEYARKDGSVIPIGIRYWLVRDEKGEPAGIWALVRDLTEEASVQTELKKRMSEIEKLNRFMMGRETRIIEVKKEVNELLDRLGEPARYKV